MSYREGTAEYEGDDRISISFLEGAMPKVNKVLAERKMRMVDFADLYSEEVVKKDILYADKLDQMWAKSNRHLSESEKSNNERLLRLSKMLEAIMHDPKVVKSWIAPNAHSLKTSRYDDYANGIDALLELREPPQQASYIGMGLDVTFSAEFAHKIQGIKNDIDQGKLTRVKYFASDFTHTRGEKTNIPKVVVGIDPSHMTEIAPLWARDDYKGIAEHPA